MKFIDKELKPLKIIMRDAIIVMSCSIISTYIYFNIDKNITEFFNVITNTKIIDSTAPQVFTDQPGF